jgi:hypothetical protein
MKRSLYVCTIEKANSLVNSFIEHNRMSEIGIVVVDEVNNPMMDFTFTGSASIEMFIVGHLHLINGCILRVIGRVLLLVTYDWRRTTRSHS